LGRGTNKKYAGKATAHNLVVLDNKKIKKSTRQPHNSPVGVITQVMRVACFSNPWHQKVNDANGASIDAQGGGYASN